MKKKLFSVLFLLSIVTAGCAQTPSLTTTSIQEIFSQIENELGPSYSISDIYWETGSFTEEEAQEAIVSFIDNNQEPENASDWSEVWLLRLNNGTAWEAVEKLAESDSTSFTLLDIEMQKYGLKEIHIKTWQNNGWGHFDETDLIISLENTERKELLSLEGYNYLSAEEETAKQHQLEFKDIISNGYIDVIDTIIEQTYETSESTTEMTYEFDGEKYTTKGMLTESEEDYEGYSLDTELKQEDYTIQIYNFGPGAWDLSDDYYEGAEEKGIIVIIDNTTGEKEEFYTSFADIFFDGPGGFGIEIGKFEDQKLYFKVSIGYDGLAGKGDWYVYDNSTKTQQVVKTTWIDYGWLDECDQQLCSTYGTETYDETLAANFPEELNDPYYVRQYGRWFSLEHPFVFTVIAKESDRSTDGFISQYDGLSFMSPDKSVEFYIYSPMWTGETSWTEAQPDETEINRTESLEETSVYHTKTEEIIFQGPGYTRISTEISSIEPADDHTVTNHVFGIKYTNDESYENYKEDYEHFKNSLEQYLD